MSPLLSVQNLRKSYAITRNRLGRVTKSLAAVDDVSFELERGETLAIVGESGAGKSTVGRLVLRLIKPDSGSVHLEGKDLSSLRKTELRRERSRIQMIFQDPYSSLDPKVTIAGAVAEPLLLHTDMRRAERNDHVHALLGRVGIRSDQMDRFPYELSGGQLQRVAIARAIATGSAFIVCDEPVAALDVSIRAQVINLLRDLQNERGIAYLFVSHDLSLVGAIANRVAVMYAGKIVEIGPTEAIFANPQHPYTQQLLAAIPEPDPNRRKLAALPAAQYREDHDGSWDGCAYYQRCPHAFDRCKTAMPALEAKGPHGARCHLYSTGSDPQELGSLEHSATSKRP